MLDEHYFFYYPIPPEVEFRKKTRACCNDTMEDIENGVIKSHAILSYDYQQIGNTSKTTGRFTRESESRRFYPGNSSSSRGMLRDVFAFIFGDQSCLLDHQSGINYLLSRVYYRATTPLPAVSPTFTELYRRFTDLFGLSWENSILDC